jgi:hypothetical protein
MPEGEVFFFSECVQRCTFQIQDRQHNGSQKNVRSLEKISGIEIMNKKNRKKGKKDKRSIGKKILTLKFLSVQLKEAADDAGVSYPESKEEQDEQENHGEDGSCCHFWCMLLDREMGDLIEEKVGVAQKKSQDDQKGNGGIMADRSHAIFPIISNLPLEFL